MLKDTRLTLRPRFIICLRVTVPYIFPPEHDHSTHLAHALHDAELLCRDEALQHDAYRHVHVVLVDVVSQVHLGVRLRHADHRLDVTHRDRNAPRRLERKRDNFNEKYLKHRHSLQGMYT